MGWGAKPSKIARGLCNCFCGCTDLELVGNQLQVKYVYKEDAQTPPLSPALAVSAASIGEIRKQRLRKVNTVM